MTSKSLENKKGSGRQVQLLKCAKQVCSHVFTDEEYKKIPWKGVSGGEHMVCPKCENDSTFTLWHDGTICRPGYRINAHDIEPSPRLGIRMRKRILAAKQRAVTRDSSALIRET